MLSSTITFVVCVTLPRMFQVRETGELELEEELYAKLIFLYRSPETLIKWTRRWRTSCTVKNCSLHLLFRLSSDIVCPLSGRFPGAPSSTSLTRVWSNRFNWKSGTCCVSKTMGHSIVARHNRNYLRKQSRPRPQEYWMAIVDYRILLRTISYC